jgi:hypothetical protein
MMPTRKCPQCGGTIAAHAGGAFPAQCPACGAQLPLPTETKPHHIGPRAAEPPAESEKMLRRIFEPIPPWLKFGVGALLVALMFAPFWAGVVMDKLWPKPQWWSPQELLEQLPENSTTGAPMDAVAREMPPLPPSAPRPENLQLDNYYGVQLGVPREDLQRRLNLRLQNTRGMVPEIYAVENYGDIERLTAFFYDNFLREVTIVFKRRSVTPDQLEEELREQFGAPASRTELAAAKPDAVSVGIGLTPPLAPPERMLLPKQRTLIWSNNENRVQAVISYDKTETTAALEVNISAAKWLDQNRPRIGALPVIVPQTNGAAPPATEPRRLFP